MPSPLIAGYAGGGPTGTQFMLMAGSCNQTIWDSTEANVSPKLRLAGTISNLMIWGAGVDNPTVYKSRKNSADGAFVINSPNTSNIRAGDNYTTESIAAGDTWSIDHSTAGADAPSLVRAVFTASAAAGGSYVASQPGGTSGFPENAAAGPHYIALGASMDTETSETNAKTRIRAPGTFQYLQVYISANGLTASTTVRVRKNGANGNQSVSIGSGATGYFEDLSNSDTVAAGDDVNFQFTPGSTGTTITTRYAWLAFTPNANAEIYDFTSGNMTSFTLTGAAAEATRLLGSGQYWTTSVDLIQTTMDHGYAGTASNLRIFIKTNTAANAATFSLRKNGANVNNTFSVGAAATGLFEDVSHTDSFDRFDIISMHHGTWAGGGSIIGIWVGITEAVQALSVSRTRMYFESTGNTVQQETSLTGGWASGVATSPLPWTTKKRTSAATSLTKVGDSTSGHFNVVKTFVSAPLRAQTIGGTCKAQMRCSETNNTDNYTIAYLVKVIKPDGTDRGILSGQNQTASDDTSAQPPEMVTSLTNRKFQDSVENSQMGLTSVTALDGDMLLIELGFRQASTSAANATFSVGTDNGTDLPEDDSTTTANDPWFEFSDPIQFQDIYLFDAGFNPTDNGSANEPTTLTMTRATGLQTGDLILMIGLLQVATTGQISVSATGGATWTTVGETAANDEVIFVTRARIPEAGLSANPSLQFAAQAGTQPASLAWLVFRPPDPSFDWYVDVAYSGASVAAPGSPFTITITGQTSLHSTAIAVAGWGVNAANTFTSLSGAGWDPCGDGLDQGRNTAGSDQSFSFAYRFQGPPAASGNVSKNESAGTAGLSFIVTLAAVPFVADHRPIYDEFIRGPVKTIGFDL